MSTKDFTPNWYEDIPHEKSFRSLLKWGAPNEFKHPNKRLYQLMKDSFDLDDDYFKVPKNLALDVVEQEIKPALSDEQIAQFVEILGQENVKTDTYNRIRVSYGKTMIDLLRLRNKIIENLPHLVLYPRGKDDVLKIVEYCQTQKIPVYVYGGGSSVTRGTEAVKGGVSLDMGVHMKRILQLNETNQTVTVEPGIFGPEYEKQLNNAKKFLGAKLNYTGGHFPQSFEYSTVGGWVVTKGAGQNSTYYGKAENLVISQEYVTPTGIIKTADYPADATGPDLDQIMIGAEGAFGILVAVTMKIFQYMPKNQKHFSYMFKTWDDAQKAARQIMQGQFGNPSAFRISDPEETDVALKLYGVEGTPIEKILDAKGYKAGSRCLFLGYTDGDKDFAKFVKNKVHQVAKANGAMNTTPLVAMKWKHGRFKDPYMREDLQDYGIMIDTLECSVNWEILPKVHEGVRSFIKSRPNTIAMTHMSHVYQQGANLYFIFIAKMDNVDEYLEFQKGILDNILKYGASMSHHHGIGKMIAPWLEKQIGTRQLDVYKALKKHFDPDNIMNPGGTLALD